jgi:hypothetical protein
MQPVFNSRNAGETVACMHFVFLPNHFTFKHRLQANHLLSFGAGCWVRTRRWACLTELALLRGGRICKCDRHLVQAFMRNSMVKSSSWERDISRGEYKSSCLLLTGMYTATLVTARYLRPKLSHFSPIHIHFNIFHPSMRLSDWSHLFRRPK